MKSKLLSFLSMSVMLIAGLTSCSDKNNDAVDNQPESNIADYTVILWIDGGGVMDPFSLCDLKNMILMREDGRIGNNVNVVGSFAVSDRYKDALKAKGIASVFSFELGEKTGLSSDTISALNRYNSKIVNDSIVPLPNDKNIQTTVNLYDLTTHCLKNCADNTSMNMTKSADLAAFIKKAATEHPAKNYVLYFISHGSGYDPSADEADIDGTNVYSNVINSAGVAKAIKDSGVKIQSIVFNSCLMATLENFAILKGCTDYIIASCETTISGYMSQYVANLSAAGNDVEKMKEETKKVIDYYTSLIKIADVTSHGFYDMSYTDQLMASVKQSAQWFANANTTNEVFMQNVVEGTVYCNPNFPDGVDENNFKEYYASRKSIREMIASDPASFDIEQFFDNLYKILRYMDSNMYNYYCFGDMMKTALDMKDDTEARGLDFSTLQSIYDQYMSTLRQMAYIKCSFSATEDDGYLYASPSVNLFTMNKNGYFTPNCVKLYKVNDDGQLIKDNYGCNIVDTDLLRAFVDKVINADTPDISVQLMYQYFGGTWYDYFAKLETVESRYTNSEFNKMTGWAQVLRTLPSNPIYMINPMRIEKSGAVKDLLNINIPENSKKTKFIKRQ